MWSKILRAGVIVSGVGLAVLPLRLDAQMSAPGAAEAAPAAEPALAGEAAPAAPAAPTNAQIAAGIAARIADVQKRALQDPALGVASREINTLITATLPKVDPAYPQYAARAQTLRTDVAAAQAAGDNAKLRELADEAKQLNANIAAAQEKAKEDPAVKEKLEAYKVQLFTKMVELDPEVQELVKQLEALQAQGTAAGS